MSGTPKEGYAKGPILNEGAYRTPDAPEPSDDEPTVEEGLTNILRVLEPYDAKDATRILSAIAALYDLPFFERDIERKDIHEAR